MTKRVYKNDSGYSSYVAGISNGGTSGATVKQAVDRLGLLTVDMLGAEKGLAVLESVDGQPVLPMSVINDESIANKISVLGLTNIDTNTQLSYTIVNFDSFTKYTVVAVNGSVDSVMGPEIRYTPPTTPGECGFTINGQKILLRAIVGAYVNPPTITSPANNSSDKGPDVTITTSSFQTTGGIDNHLSTDYHIAEDPLFETGFVTYSNQITGKTSFTISSLQAAKTYYVKARHRGEALSVSGWSPVVIFTTKVEYKPDKPFISSPLNAQEGLGPSLTATSSAYSLAESSQSTLIDVEWHLSKSNTFSPLINSSSESGLNAVWNNIDYASAYYLRMRHSSNIGTVPSDWSDVISFMSGAIPNPNTPTITAPVGQQDIDLTLVADAFHSDGGEIHASSTWQISTDSNFATILTTKSVTDSAIFLTTYTVTGLNTASTYYARVSYKSNQGRSSTFSAPVTFNTLGVLVNTPSISFVNGTDPYLNALASLYTANASAGGVSKMHWQVYTTSDFTSGVIYDQEDNYNGTGNPSLTGIYLPPETVLYFRMRYKSANDFYSGYSNVLASTSKTYLTTPALNTATVTETTGVFTWNRGNNTIPGVTTTYRFTISVTPDFSSGTANINTSATTLNATLVYGTTYYWKVQQTDTLASVAYTEVKTSTTGTVSVGVQPAVIYTVTSSSDTYNEGESAVFVLTKSREDTSGDFLTFSGSAGNAADINYPLENTLTFGTGNNAQLIVTAPLLADNFTDGDKTLTANWRTGSITGPIVASKTVFITDISLTPIPSVSAPVILNPSGGSVNIGPSLLLQIPSPVFTNALNPVLLSVTWQASLSSDFSTILRTMSGSGVLGLSLVDNLLDNLSADIYYRCRYVIAFLASSGGNSGPQYDVISYSDWSNSVMINVADIFLSPGTLSKITYSDNTNTTLLNVQELSDDGLSFYTVRNVINTPISTYRYSFFDKNNDIWEQTSDVVKTNYVNAQLTSSDFIANSQSHGQEFANLDADRQSALTASFVIIPASTSYADYSNVIISSNRLWAIANRNTSIILNTTFNGIPVSYYSNHIHIFKRTDVNSPWVIDSNTTGNYHSARSISADGSMYCSVDQRSSNDNTFTTYSTLIYRKINNIWELTQTIPVNQYLGYDTWADYGTKISSSGNCLVRLYTTTDSTTGGIEVFSRKPNSEELFTLYSTDLFNIEPVTGVPWTSGNSMTDAEVHVSGYGETILVSKPREVALNTTICEGAIYYFGYGLPQPAVLTPVVDPIPDVPYTLIAENQTYTVAGSGGDPDYTATYPAKYYVTVPQVILNGIPGTACELKTVHGGNVYSTVPVTINVNTLPISVDLTFPETAQSDTTLYGTMELRRLSDNLLLATVTPVSILLGAITPVDNGPIGSPT
jgi:hypothetical protein